MLVITNKTKAERQARPLVGIVPAAGQGLRLPNRTGSKELFPLPAWRFPGEDSARAGVISEHLLGALRIAGVARALVVTRADKLDIAHHFEQQHEATPELTYQYVSESPSVPHSILTASELTAGCDVVFGFPDILFSPDDALSQLLVSWSPDACDVLLGLFAADRPEKSDTVDLTADGRVTRILVKHPATQLRYAWILAIWGPSFSNYLADFIENRAAKRTENWTRSPELHLGHVLQSAIDDKMTILGLPIPDGQYIDIGTPDDAKRVRDLTRRVKPL